MLRIPAPCPAPRRRRLRREPRPARLLALALLLTAGAWLCLGSRVGAQDTVFVCDSSEDIVLRLVDLDGDGVIDPLTEVFSFYSDLSPGPDLSTPNHLLLRGGGLLLADGGTLDAVLWLRDLNGDGDAEDDGEVTPFYDDTSSGPDLSTPNGLAATADGSVVFVADDGSALQAILRLEDLDGDGDANDAGEVSIYYDGTAATPPPPALDPESLALDASGALYVGDTATGQVFRLVDMNADGDALDPGEATVFYSPAGPHPVQDLDAIQVDEDGSVYVIGEDDGTVLRLLDLDGDGDALDPGEASLFLDGSDPGALITDPNDAILIAPGTLLLADGALDGLFVAADQNGDGDARDAGEIVPLFDDGGVLLGTPSGVAFLPDAPVIPPPTLNAVVPPSGPLAGGNSVDLEGTDLLDAFQVLFGDEPVMQFLVESSERIQAVVPAGAGAGPVDVSVETPGGEFTLPEAYEYIAPLELAELSPDHGSSEGGTSVVIQGSGWSESDPLQVFFGGTVAAVESQAEGSVTVSTSPAPPGLVDVDVTLDGQQATLPAAFRFQVPFLRGDVDGSGLIDLSDPILLLGFLHDPAQQTPPCLDALDLNDDGEIEITDAILLLEYLFIGGAPPHPPFPDPGLDPTPDPSPGCESTG